jgi:mediator of RNA polymerase II transcription subunit 14
VHSLLVAQYWINRPGKKNWIEIDVSNNKPKSGKISWRGPHIPLLTSRWFHEGKEVEDANFNFDWKDRLMERITKRVIVRRTGNILRSIRESLNSKLIANAHLSDVEPANSTLETTLGTRCTFTTLPLELVTGNYILRPATALSTRVEKQHMWVIY